MSNPVIVRDRTFDEMKQKSISQWLDIELDRLTNRRFYGKLTLIFEDGKIQRAIKEEIIKL